MNPKTPDTNAPKTEAETNKNNPNSSEQLFLNALKFHLEALQVANVEDILSDYREHFLHGKQNGKTEAQISSDLGNPVTIAKAYEAENLIREVKATKHSLQWTVVFKILGRLLVLAPFNFFMLLIPGLILGGFFFAGWAVTFGFIVAAITGLGFVLQSSILTLSVWAGVSGIAASLAMFGMAAISGMVVFIFSKFVFMSLISYLQWNLNFILEK